MLTDACAAKPAKAAFLEGPVQCGARGWFCRIVHQPGWSVLGSDGKNSHGDDNFQHCNAPARGNATRDWDGDGHCHGSDTDSTYGWWVRDHWFRNYPGRLHCCCGWATSAGYGTFRLNFHHFDRFELDLRGHTQVRGAAFPCLRLKLADIVLI